MKIIQSIALYLSTFPVSPYISLYLLVIQMKIIQSIALYLSTFPVSPLYLPLSVGDPDEDHPEHRRISLYIPCIPLYLPLSVGDPDEDHPEHRAFHLRPRGHQDGHRALHVRRPRQEPEA